jgi:hypothetical protein
LFSANPPPAYETTVETEEGYNHYKRCGQQQHISTLKTTPAKAVLGVIIVYCMDGRL